jgi:hypothetical protein
MFYYGADFTGRLICANIFPYSKGREEMNIWIKINISEPYFSAKAVT